MGRLRILKAGETAMLIETDGLDAAMGLYDSIQDARQRLEDGHRGNDDGSNRDEGDDAGQGQAQTADQKRPKPAHSGFQDS